jgi:GT2 family glycosyltransferase
MRPARHVRVNPMPASSPTVTVIIPSRDRPALLAQAVASALAQHDVDLEIIVVDDGSVGGVALPPAIERLPNLRVLRHAGSRGDAAARNTGIAAANGRWIAFLDDDDLWSPWKLASQLSSLRKHPSAAYAYCAVVELDGNGKAIKDFAAPAPATIVPMLCRRNAIPAGSSNVIARTAMLRELGGFDTDFANISDWDLWLRMARHAPGVACPERLVAYRRHVAPDQARRSAALTPHSVLADSRGLIEQLRRLEAKHVQQTPPLRADWDAYARWLVAAGPRRTGQRWLASRMYLRLGIRYRSPRALLGAIGALIGERAFGRVLALIRRPGPRPDWLDAAELTTRSS